MRIVDICERTVPISRYRDLSLPSGGLTTSMVAVITDVIRDGRPVIGYGFASIGRFGQGGLIRERFAPRLLTANEASFTDADGTNFDPFRCWELMMAGEKPGGHGERCIAVGTLDMAIWDAAAKIAGMPLHHFLARQAGTTTASSQSVRVYAGGGYYYPSDDVVRLMDEIREFRELGYTHVKIKIGSAAVAEDLKLIEAAASLLPGTDHLSVTAATTFYSLIRSIVTAFLAICGSLSILSGADGRAVLFGLMGAISFVYISWPLLALAVRKPTLCASSPLGVTPMRRTL